MNWNRRTWLQRTWMGSGAALFGMGYAGQPTSRSQQLVEEELVAPTHAIIPVVGDGKWISNEPPKEESGYYEPRTFELTLEIRLRGLGDAHSISAFTAAPIQVPEQQFEDFQLQQVGCRANVQQLTPLASRLTLQADSIRRGQILRAVAKYRMSICKTYFGYHADMFPLEQPLSRTAKTCLGDSPGIKASSREVRKIAREIEGDLRHPWKIAETFRDWVWNNIKGRHQSYTNVDTALRNRVGDCEERAAVFVALCRNCNIPARLVWVPNHNWAEFMLVDEKGQEHWIPAHTSAYSWFGWTGAHELVLQKGDKVPLPGRSLVRLIYDNVRCIGKKPDASFSAELLPVADSQEDAGPGARQKQKNGQWKLVGNHHAQKFMRI